MEKRLGRGLGSLLGNGATLAPKQHEGAAPAPSAPNQLPVTSIRPNPFQPRKRMDPVGLEELRDSIREHGIIQPITVRKMGYDKYQLISGERRFQASKLAGLEKVPAYIRTADDEQMLEMALIENIQREDLNPIEISLAYQRMIDEVGG